MTSSSTIILASSLLVPDAFPTHRRREDDDDQEHTGGISEKRVKLKAILGLFEEDLQAFSRVTNLKTGEVIEKYKDICIVSRLIFIAMAASRA